MAPKVPPLARLPQGSAEASTRGVLIYIDMGVSKNKGTPKSSILIGFSIINHPFWGTPIFGNIHIMIYRIHEESCSFAWHSGDFVMRQAE